MSAYRHLESRGTESCEPYNQGALKRLRKDWDRVDRDTNTLISMKPEHKESYLRQREIARDELCRLLESEE